MGRFKVKDLNAGVSIDKNTIVCFDFGTALCKAAVSTMQGEGEVISPLELGTAADDPRQEYRYFCPSSIYISSNRKVFFGHNAQNKWAGEMDSNISKIESMKRWLSTDPIDDFDEIPVGQEFLPSGVVLKKRYVIIMFLAYLSRLVVSQMKAHGFNRNGIRRFSRPVWDRDRAYWVDQTMRDSLKTAQVVADSIGGHWAEDGIMLDDLVELIDGASSIDIQEGFVERQAVLEPIAAGFLAVRSSGNGRDVSIVIDVGAGTTDVAAFISRPAFRGKAAGEALPTGRPQSTPFAGDFLDWVLLGHIEGELGALWSTDLRYQREAQGMVRDWKEALFKVGNVRPTFINGKVCKSLSKDQFVREERIREFVTNIQSVVKGLFPKLSISGTSAIEQLLNSLHAIDSINVVFAGGGASLPFLDSITNSPLVIDRKKLPLIRRKMELSENFANSRNYKTMYPQLSVAMGGASRSYPRPQEPLLRGLGASKQTFGPGARSVASG